MKSTEYSKKMVNVRTGYLNLDFKTRKNYERFDGYDIQQAFEDGQEDFAKTILNKIKQENNVEILVDNIKKLCEEITEEVT